MHRYYYYPLSILLVLLSDAVAIINAELTASRDPTRVYSVGWHFNESAETNYLGHFFI